MSNLKRLFNYHKQDSTYDCELPELSYFSFGQMVNLSKEKFNPLNTEERNCIELEHINSATGSINGYISSGSQLSTKSVFKKGDVLFGKLRPYLRKYWLAEFDGVCSSEIWVFRANKKVIANKYLFYYIQLNEFISIANISSGSKMPRADWNFIVNYPLSIPLPPLPEQKKIAEILSTWDRAIEATEKLIEAKTKLKKGLMQKLLTGKVRFKEFVKQFDYVHTRYGKVPKDWQILKANSVFSRHSQNCNGNIELLSVTQDKGVIPRSMLEARVTMPTGSTESFKLVEKGDFVISLRAFQGGIEYSAYTGLVSPAYTVIRPKVKIDNGYFKYYFKSSIFLSQLAIAVIGIRDGKQISFEDFSAIKLFYPEINEQKKIAKILTDLDKEIEKYDKKLTALQQQKKGLMQVLLTGKVRVKV